MTIYRSVSNINIYDSVEFKALATQMGVGRHLRIIEQIIEPQVLRIQLLEDGYVGYVPNFFGLEAVCYEWQAPGQSQVSDAIPAAIAYVKKAMAIENQYLWGGTVAPNYDCSGLMQAAFWAAGIWLPRDAYQQEEFTKPVRQEDLKAGDLVFFGRGIGADHVGMYIGTEQYIHSSGKEKGNNGIGINFLRNDRDTISSSYFAELRGFGRVIQSYRHQN